MHPWHLAALLLVSSTSFGASRLAVVDVDAPPSMIGMGALVTEEVLKAAQAQGFEVVSPERIRLALGGKLYDEVKACHEHGACAAEKLTGLGAQKVVTGTLLRDERSYLLKLWLFSAPDGNLLSSVDLPVLIASQRFTSDLQAVVPKFVRGEPLPPASLHVTTNIPSATVSLDGQLRGMAPLDLKLGPGRHEVSAQKQGYLETKRVVNVGPGETANAELTLIPGHTGTP